jgi:hypothetical protein
MRQFPALASLGPRQVGKTTRVRNIAQDLNGIYFILERPSDRFKLNDPELVLGGGGWPTGWCCLMRCSVHRDCLKCFGR